MILQVKLKNKQSKCASDLCRLLQAKDKTKNKMVSPQRIYALLALVGNH